MSDNIDVCLVCSKEIPPGPDFCSADCEVLHLRRDLADLQWILNGIGKNSQYRDQQMYRQGVLDGQEAGLKIAMAVLNQTLPRPILIDTTPLDLEKL
jgi:hypothetical protein